MPKLLAMPARKVIKTLIENGFEKVQQRGSHIKFKKKEGKKVFTVFVPNYPMIGQFVMASIVRQSGFPRELFCG